MKRVKSFKSFKHLLTDELFLSTALMAAGLSLLLGTVLWAVVTPCPNQPVQSQVSKD